MSDKRIPLLYSFRRCPYAMRARLAIKSADIGVELREVLLRDKPEHMLELSPKGTVPVLELPGGKIIDESLEIMHWALAKNDPNNLHPGDAALRAEINALIEESDGPFKHHLDRTKYANRYEGADPLEHRNQASIFLRKLDKRLEESPYLFGGKPSLADLAIAPFVRQFANIDRDWFDNEPWPHLIKWLEQFIASELFASVMEKYEPWQEGDEQTLF